MELLTTINLLCRNVWVLFGGPNKVCVGFVVVTLNSARTEVVHCPGPVFLAERTGPSSGSVSKLDVEVVCGLKCGGDSQPSLLLHRTDPCLISLVF